MKQAVWRDASGAIINIGEWDYQAEPSPILAQGGEECEAFEGEILTFADLVEPPPLADVDDHRKIAGHFSQEFEAKGGERIIAQAGRVLGWDEKNPIIRNPVPEGVTHADEDVVERADGGLAVSADYVSLRRAAYPSLTDQLDAMWKGGDAADAMRKAVLEVKATYPK